MVVGLDQLQALVEPSGMMAVPMLVLKVAAGLMDKGLQTLSDLLPVAAAKVVEEVRLELQQQVNHRKERAPQMLAQKEVPPLLRVIQILPKQIIEFL